MREKMKKGIAYLLSSVLFVSTFITALPQLTITAHAEDTGKAIQLVTGGAADNIVGAQKSNVYFGTYLQSGDKTNGFNQDPIKWRVLSNSDRKLFLLSDKNLDVGEYHLSDDAVTWKGSTIRSWLNGYDGSANDLKENYSEKKSDSFLGTAFSEKELAVIPSVKINNPPTVFENYSTPGCEDTNDKVYLLSIDEATDTAYGFTDNYISTDTRTSANTAYVGAGGKTGDASNTFDEGKNDVWWLRSPGRSDNEATFVSSIGYVYQPGNSVSNSSVALRPALNINLESILFTSAAKDGKISGNVGADALTAVADYSGDDWKLTVEDSERDLFQARRLDNNEITAGGKVKIKYYGALEGTNEYVSAIITDSAGTILYYGNIASCASSTKGEAEINIPDSFAPGYKLYVFSEQCNGDYKTD